MNKIKPYKYCLVRISDVDTGEIISLAHDYNRFGLIDELDLQKFARRWFDSFMRGLQQGRNLEIQVCVKDSDAHQLDFFSAISPQK